MFNNNEHLEEVIKQGENELLKGYYNNLITFNEIEELLEEAKIDEEYEVAEAVKRVIRKIKNN